MKIMPLEQQISEDPLVISYRGLRRAVGLIGIALPLVLVAGECVLPGGSGLLDSLSAYYWSVWMRDIFVGSLCAIGIFLLSYRGDSWKDNLAGDLACVFAIGVALFPTSQGKEFTTMGTVHYISAAGLFLTLAYFCLFSFPGRDQGLPALPKKPLRNKIYKGCGISILLCIVLIAIVQFLPSGLWLHNLKPIFVLESIAIWAFGWSWYIKGKGLSPIQG